MKIPLSRCTDCAEDNLLLTQVNSGPEIIFLCSDCYNLKYSNEVQNEIKYSEKEKTNYYGLGKFNYFIFKFLCSRFSFSFLTIKNL